MQVGIEIAEQFADGVWYVDLASITDSDLVPVATARAFGLPDQRGRSTVDTIIAFVNDRHMLIVLDNCEHVLEASAELTVALLGACKGLTVLATSREPIGVPGEVTRRVPSLSLSGEAVDLFIDRACRATSDFRLSEDNATTVAEICRRLDGVPLAIELAAARVRALSPVEIVSSLHDRFQLLTGGTRTAVRRQQTLRASVDWSHALLTERERILFRRLAVFMGGFDVDAARAVACSDDDQRYQVVDELMLLVDKSLVIAENTGRRTRYRLLETMRQYALEKLSASGEADAVGVRHRDYYTSMAASLDARARTGDDRRVEQTEAELENLRAAFGWSLENSDIERALQLASSLEPMWLSRGFIREGLSWMAAALAEVDRHHANVAPAVRVRAIVDRALLRSWLGLPNSLGEAEEALTISRDLDEPALLMRAIVARAYVSADDAEAANSYFTEAAELARNLGDSWMLSQILGRETLRSTALGDAVATRSAAEEGLLVAEQIGDRFTARACRFGQGFVRACEGDLAGALALFREVIDDATAAHDAVLRVYPLIMEGIGLAYTGETSRAQHVADSVLRGPVELGEYQAGAGHAIRAIAHLAAGDAAAAWQEWEAGLKRTGLHRASAGMYVWAALAPLACGDLAAARRWADDVVSAAKGSYLSSALAARAHVNIAQGRRAEAGRDAEDALTSAASMPDHLGLPHLFQCLAALASVAGSHVEAARLAGVADAIRQRMGAVRFKILDADHDALVAALREALGHKAFDTAWAEGAALSTNEAIGYARRAHTERTRPFAG